MLRVAAVQYHFKHLASFKEFARIMTSLVSRVHKKGGQILCLPEYLGYHLELFEKKGKLEHFLELFQNLAYKTKLFIQAGTILIHENGRLLNRAYIFFPNGLFDWQDKVYLTPVEKTESIQSGYNSLKIFQSPECLFAIAICYDCEFPYLIKNAVCQGAKLIIVPSCTETLAGYYRVAISSRARAIENQCFIVHSCTVGKAGDWLDNSFGKAGIYSPCDGNFPYDGILSQGRLNKNSTIIADLNFIELENVRKTGSVRNFNDYTLDNALIH